MDKVIKRFKDKIERNHPKTNKGTLVVRLKNGRRLIIWYMYGNKYSVECYNRNTKTRELLELLGDSERVAKIIYKEKHNDKHKLLNKLKAKI